MAGSCEPGPGGREAVLGVEDAITNQLVVEVAGLGVVQALRREAGEQHHVLGWRQPLDHLRQPALAGPGLGEDDCRQRVLSQASMALAWRSSPVRTASVIPCGSSPWRAKSGGEQKASR
jgi:hypothetical protein